MLRILYISIVVILIVSACSKSAEDHPALARAREVHNQAFKVASVVKQTLSIDSGFHKDSIRVWTNELAQWERNVMEVPGDHKEHDHHHNHNHHQPTIELTPEQVLAVQLELLQTIEGLRNRIDTTKKNVSN